MVIDDRKSKASFMWARCFTHILTGHVKRKRIRLFDKHAVQRSQLPTVTRVYLLIYSSDAISKGSILFLSLSSNMFLLPLSPNFSPVHSKTGIWCLYKSLFFTLTSSTLCHRWRLPVFDFISHVVGGHARSDAAIAAFTLTSTPTTRNLGAKTLPAGERFGLALASDIEVRQYRGDDT